MTPAPVYKMKYLVQGFPTCGMRTTNGTEKLSFLHTNLDSQLSSLHIELCFSINICSCTRYTYCNAT